ncbi:MAG: hypothetical protein ABFD24_00925 [Anaerolineaceae bacterium]|jgi:hypothetical protein
MNTLIPFTREKSAVSLAQWLVRCHPAEFRNQYEDELNQVLRTLVRYGLDDGNDGTANYLWRVCIPDLCSSMIRERFNQWEENMKRNFGVWIGAGLIVLWVLYVGLTEARIFLHLPIKDPTIWLLGDTPANWAFTSLNVFIILAPILALILMAVPHIQFSRGAEEGDLAVIRLRKVTGASRVMILTASLISAMILFLLMFGGRL